MACLLQGSLRGGSPKQNKYVVDEVVPLRLNEGEATIKALRCELLTRNAQLGEAREELRDLKLAVADLQNRADDAEARQRELRSELIKTEAERSRMERAGKLLENELSTQKWAPPHIREACESGPHALPRENRLYGAEE